MIHKIFIYYFIIIEINYLNCGYNSRILFNFNRIKDILLLIKEKLNIIYNTNPRKKYLYSQIK